MAEFRIPTYGAAGVQPGERITDPEGYVNALAREAHRFTEDDLVQKPWYQRWYEHPGVLSAVSKADRERLDDARQAYVLDRLAEQFPTPKDQERLPGYIQRPLALHQVNREGLVSDYSDSGLTGALRPESRAGAALEWASSLSGMRGAATQGLRDYADYAVSNAMGGIPDPKYPDAYSDFMASANTFTEPLPPAIKNSRYWLRPFGVDYDAEDRDAMSYSQRRAGAHAGVDAISSPTQWWDELQDDTQGAASAFRRGVVSRSSEMPSQRDVLVDSGVPVPIAYGLDAIGEIYADPFSSVAGSVGMARTGNSMLRAGQSAGQELKRQALKNLAEEAAWYSPFMVNETVQAIPWATGSASR